MTTTYTDFLAAKAVTAAPVGRGVEPGEINPKLFAFQREIVRWALRRGRAAIFADTGLGKGFMLLEWCRLAAETSLLLAPLAVAQQFVAEAAKLGIPVTLCRTQADVRPGVNLTNYEMLDHFEPTTFGAIALDESSILKAYGGTTRQALNAFAKGILYRLAATATPAPNDSVELTNHAEFLGVMEGKEIIALYYTQDGNTTHRWRLKGHAKADFWKWMTSWAVAVRKPSDLGFPDDGYNLPLLAIHQVTVADEAPTDGALFRTEAEGLLDRQRARKASLAHRVAAAAAQVAQFPEEPWIIWCDHNAESDALVKAIPGAVQVTGADSAEAKAQAMLDFAAGKLRVLVTKPTIAGFGMNWQHCRKVAFVGLSDSFEQFYQAVRRCWRFGQVLPVDVWVFTSAAEGAVVRNIKRKERQAREMMDKMIEEGGRRELAESLAPSQRDVMTYETETRQGKDWTLHLGDSIETIDLVETESVGLSVFSPPFPGMYAYTNSPRDIGNTRDIADFMDHFRYLVGPDKLLRVTMPGRMACVHLMQLTAMQNRDGYIGLKDYRGETIKMMQEAGWIYAGEACIEKNPQIQATRNKERGLLFKTLSTDSSLMRMALADYLLYFRKPGQNPVPIKAGVSKKYNQGGGWITEEEWIEWASPIWRRKQAGVPGGILETEVLNVRQARDTDDERHLCPLQLGVIERAVKLWSAPGDLVYSPFTGIASEGFKALQLGRRFVGGEIKRSYFESAILNLEAAAAGSQQFTIFDLLDREGA